MAADAEKEEGLLQYVEFELRGPIASENRLTSSMLPTMLYRECLYFQHIPHCDRDRKGEFSEIEYGKLSLAMLAGLTALSHLAFCPSGGGSGWVFTWAL